MKSVLLANLSRRSVAETPGVDLIDAHFVIPSDEVFMHWSSVTESHSTVDTDLAGTASSTVWLATKCWCISRTIFHDRDWKANRWWRVCRVYHDSLV